MRRSRATLNGLLRTAISAAAVVAILAASPAVEAQHGHSPYGFAKGRLLVQAKAGVDDADFRQVLSAHGGRSEGKLAGLDIHVVTLPPGQSERDTAAALARHPHVKFAELDELVAPDGTTSDPLASYQWHLTKVGAPTAWATSTGAGVVIAIVDTGVDGTHPDLSPHMVAGWNFIDNNSNAADLNGHGTAVAGTAAATGNNAIGVASVAWNARIMPVRIADANGFAYWSTIAQGVTWAADHGARVANVSYAVGSSSTVQSAAQYMRSKGGVVVVSAGNTGTVDATAPSDTMVIVSATGSTDTRTSWSTYGSFVDLAAPGYNIYTTVRGGGYGYWWGTSFSAPVVSGVAALVKALRPDFGAAQIESALFASPVDLGAAGKDAYYGYGRVSAAGAVAAALAAPAFDSTPPSVAITAPTGGTTVYGSVTVNVTASDNVGVMRIDLKAKGVVVGSDSVAPYSFVWNSASVANGSATLTAVAYDAAGNATTSAPVAVTVSNTTNTSSAAAPTVGISSPAGGSKVGNGSVSVSAWSNDPAGIASAKLSIDGVVVASGNMTTLSYNWNAKNVASGSHTISMWTQDVTGKTASTSITVRK